MGQMTFCGTYKSVKKCITDSRLNATRTQLGTQPTRPDQHQRAAGKMRGTARKCGMNGSEMREHSQEGERASQKRSRIHILEHQQFQSGTNAIHNNVTRIACDVESGSPTRRWAACVRATFEAFRVQHVRHAARHQFNPEKERKANQHRARGITAHQHRRLRRGARTGSRMAGAQTERCPR